MHDRAVRPAGAVKSAAAVASEMMLLLNIDVRIAQVRPRVEATVQGFPALSHAPAPAFLVRCSVRCPQRIRWGALHFPLRQRTLQPLISVAFLQSFCKEEGDHFVVRPERNL